MKVLRAPCLKLLPDYCDALEQGWSPDNLRPEAAVEQLALAKKDPNDFLSRQTDMQGEGPPVTLPDGSTVSRLPSLRRWIFKEGFAGSIGLRWKPGTEALPPTCLGHVGYSVVPWRRREGLAGAALIELLPTAREVGLSHVDITTDPDNFASIGVIEKASGRLVKEFDAPNQLGGGRHLLFRIDL